MKLLEELVGCWRCMQGGSSSALERAQEREQDQGRRDATANERWPREVLPHLPQPPVSPKAPGSSICLAQADDLRATAQQQRTERQERRKRRGGRDQGPCAHQCRTAGGRQRPADLPGQRSPSPKIAATKAAGCRGWPWPWWPRRSPLSPCSDRPLAVLNLVQL